MTKQQTKLSPAPANYNDLTRFLLDSFKIGNTVYTVIEFSAASWMYVPKVSVESLQYLSTGVEILKNTLFLATFTRNDRE